MSGLFLTAVVIPFLGLLALSLFDGDYLAFFGRLGTYPGWIISVLILSLIGPFAVIPRCITIAFGAIATVFPALDFLTFSLMSCFIIYLCTINRSKTMDILGLFLTPILLLSLFTIIFFGIFLSPAQMMPSSFVPFEAFKIGLSEGYNTMDLFASFMFSHIILKSIKTTFGNIHKNPKQLTLLYLKSSIIGMGLLSIIYFGMCYVAASHAHHLLHASSDKILAELAILVLGKHAGVVVSIAVSLACLTTAISLTIVFNDFFTEKVLPAKISNQTMLIITLMIAFLVSTLEFEGIQNILAPILKLTLPSFIVFTLLNLFYKFNQFKPIKRITYLVFILTLIENILS